MLFLFSLRKRNSELEEKGFTIKSEIEATNNETEVTIVQLNKNLAQENQKIKECKKKIQAIEDESQQMKEKHEKKIKILEESFEKTRVLLHSEIKLQS